MFANNQTCSVFSWLQCCLSNARVVQGLQCEELDADFTTAIDAGKSTCFFSSTSSPRQPTQKPQPQKAKSQSQILPKVEAQPLSQRPQQPSQQRAEQQKQSEQQKGQLGEIDLEALCSKLELLALKQASGCELPSCRMGRNEVDGGVQLADSFESLNCVGIDFSQRFGEWSSDSHREAWRSVSGSHRLSR